MAKPSRPTAGPDMRSFYTYPRLVILMLLLIVVAGAAAISTMPRLEDPHMENRVAFILTRYPGADAARVEAQISEKIEKKLREVAEVKDLSSVSRLGLSFITVEMADEVKDVGRVSALLRDKLQEVTDLPEGAGTPVYDDDRLWAFSAIIGLVWKGTGDPDYAILGRHAEELDARLANLAGTDFVRTFGLPREEIAVTVNNDLLSAIGLDANAVAKRILGGDPKNSAGVLSGTDSRFIVEVAGEIDSLERLRAIPLAVTEAGTIMTLGDVAIVERSFSDPPEALAYLSGDYGVVLGARMLETRRIDEWMAEIETILADYRSLLPASVEARVLFDQAKYTDIRLSDLMGNLAFSALIVYLTLLVTLGWRASVIAGSILPLAVLTALAVLDFAGLQIEQMVVTGMIVALGIMVDNAIVVTDEVQTRLLRGERRSHAVARTVGKLWLPLLGSTATTVIAFLPIMLMPGNAGEFVGGISASVIGALIASYVISFTIIAAIAGRVLGRRTPDSSGPGEDAPRRWWREGVDAQPVRQAFRRSLEWSMRRPKLSMALSGVLPMLGLILLFTGLEEQFFPASDRDQFHIELSLPGDASIEETRRLVEEVHALVAGEPEVVASDWYIGQSAAKFYYNLITNQDNVANYAQGMITTTSEHEVDVLIARLQPLLDRRYPHVQTLVRKLEQGPPYNAPLEIRIFGPDLETLYRLGEEVQQVMMTVPSVIHARSSLAAGRPQIVISADENAAATLGIDLRGLANQIRGAIDGEISGSLIEQTEEVPVRIRTDDAARGSLSGLRSIEIVPVEQGRETDGSFSGVPITALAEIDIRPSIGAIPRRNGQRVNTVQGFILPDVLPATALAEVNRRLGAAGFAVPAGYRVDYGGESEERNEAVGKLMARAGVLAVLMVIAIVLTYNSFRLAAITFASALQAGGLGLLSIWLFGYPLGFVVIVGLMGLIGLAINAAIVILSELKGDPAAVAGDNGAIIHGVMATGRHIISTTLTTVGGFTPLILSSSAFWPPFAVAIAGGTLLTMIVSFYFVPAAFSLATRRRPIADARLAEDRPRPVAPIGIHAAE